MDDKPPWGLRVLKFDGAIAPKVLKFDSGYAAEGCGGAPLNYRRRPLMIKPLQPPCGRGNASPFGALRHHLPPAERWDNKALQSSPFISGSQHNGALFCPLQRGKSGAARIGGGERSEPISRMLFMPYGAER